MVENLRKAPLAELSADEWQNSLGSTLMGQIQLVQEVEGLSTSFTPTKV
jgi:hypothetical protein